MLLKRSTRYSAQVCCSISYHGLRATELCALKWSQIDLRNGRLHVNRAKGGIESVHPLHGPELRALYGSTGNRSDHIQWDDQGSSGARANRSIPISGRSSKESGAVNRFKEIDRRGV